MMKKPQYLAMDCLINLLIDAFHNKTWHDDDPDAEITDEELDQAIWYAVDVLRTDASKNLGVAP